MALTDVKSEQIQSSVALAGSPTTTTQSASDNSTKIATTAYVETAVANLVASAPAALNTLDELAAALNDDASFSTTVTNSIATKLPLAGGTLTGNLLISNSKLNVGGTTMSELLNVQTGSSSATAMVEFRNTQAGTQIGMPANTNALVLKTADTERIYITSSGNVGIGETNPSQKLHVVGKIKSTDDLIIGGANPRIDYDGGSSGALRFFSVSANLERMRITSAGQVGIGTTSIDNNAKLHIEDSAYPIINLDRSSSLSDGNHIGYINFQNNGDIYGYIGVWVESASGTDGRLAFATQNGSSLTDKMTILSDGKVGIGTTSPQSTLHVNGHMILEGASGASRTLGFTSANGSTGWSIGNGIIDNTHNFRIYDNTAGAARVTLDGSGNVGIGETSPLGKLHIKEGDSGQGSVNSNFDQLVLEDDQHSGITILSGASHDGGIYFGDSGGNNLGQFKYRHSNNSFRFITNNGSDAMVIDSSGNVGIGTDPSYKLQVSGESSLGDFSANGFANLGRNADGNQDVTTLGGYGVLSGGSRYGRYGVLRFRTSANYTGSSRGYMITNGYGANKFAIIQSNSATTMPNIASAGGGASDGDPVFIIDHAGRTTMPKQPYVQGRGNAGWSATSGSASWNLQPHGNTPVTSRDHGNNYSTTNKRFTCPVDGVYLVQASWYIYQSAAATYGGQYVHPGLFKNGSSNWNGGHQPYTITGQMMERSGSGSKHYDGVKMSFAIYCSAGDYLEIYLYAPNSNTQSYENYHYFSYTLLS